MEDFGKDLGLMYARLLPLTLGVCVGVLLFIGWLWLKSDELEPPWRDLVRWAIAGVALAAVIQYPAAYQQAKDYCREQWSNAGGTSTTFEAPPAYAATKCINAWPHGP
jgi:hypothetical protein